MNNQVLIDRELLERIAHDDEGMASLADFEALRAALQSPAPKGGEPTVVAFLMKSDGCEPYANIRRDHADVTEPLMTIAQHRAIVAGLGREDGVSFGFDDRSVMVSQEAYSIFLEREDAIRDRAKREWIACSERLPDEHKAEYLCLFDGGHQQVTEWLHDDTEGWCFWYGDPTHWMPLPPSPKEGGL